MRERETPYPDGGALWAELVEMGELLLRACAAEASAAPEEDPAGLRRRTWALWERMEARGRAALEGGTFLPLLYLFEAFGLDGFERRCLALALLPEVDGRFEERYAALQGGAGRTLTAGLALRLLGGSAGERPDWLRRLSPGSVLLRRCFSDQGFAGATDLSRRLKPARRVLSFVLEEAYGDPGVAGLTLWEPPADGEAGLPPAEGEGARLVERMESFLAAGRPGEPVCFLLQGPPGAGRRTLAKRFAARRGQSLLLADGGALPGPEGPEFLEDLAREAVLQGGPVCLFGVDALLEAAETEAEAEAILRGALEVLTAAAPVSFLAGGTAWTPESPPEGWLAVPVALPAPDLGESRRLWSRLAADYPLEAAVDLEETAGKYRFTPGQMRGALDAAHTDARWEGKAAIGAEHLRRGCRGQLRHRLGERARRVETAFTWDDLILPETSKELLRSACDQLRHRVRVYGDWGFGRKLAYGSGLSMLFSGPPGTGKTMAAQIAAGELGLELYKVDLSAVVSKYVGETEKNLGEIFREAARGQAALFFDEADALFGKRTEVKDAHDKYNNMEAAFLLQKIEEYPGVSVLATNYLQNFDEAFQRRIKFIIDFPFPDARYRKLLWRAVFPAETPLDGDVDWDFLAEQFELSGSAIKNVAVNAAFLAAGAGGPVGMPELLTALRRELLKSGRHLSREDFGAYYMLVE